MPDVPHLFGATAAQVTIGREGAREAAERELAKPIYHRDDPSLVMQAILQLVEWISDFLTRAAQVAPGGWAGMLATLLLLVLVAAAVRLRAGPVGRSRARGEPLLSGRALTADEHRSRADAHTGAEEWAEAVRERLRAIARALEERAIIEPRVGRTAHELAVEAGTLLPTHAEELRAAARAFDDVWYGGLLATPDTYNQLRQLDEQLSAVRPAFAGSSS